MERKNSAARIAANNRYNAKAYDRINIAIPKGMKEQVRAAATSSGKSLNTYIKMAILAEMRRGYTEAREE